MPGIENDRLLINTLGSPQVLALSQVRENSWAHGGQGEENVLIHTLRVFESTSQFIEHPEIYYPANETIQTGILDFYNSKRRLTQLFLALVHDIGKADGLIVAEDGLTSTEGHDDRGARMLPGLYSHLEDQGIKVESSIKDKTAFLVAHHVDLTPLILSEGDYAKKPVGFFPNMLRVSENIFEDNGVFLREDKIMLLVNTFADFESGRLRPVNGQTESEFGFSDTHRDRAQALIAHHILS